MAKFKSVMDKYPAQGSAAWKRKMEQEQAIKPDTTLEELAIGPGSVAVSAIRKGLANAARKRGQWVTTPEIGSKLPYEGFKPVGRYELPHKIRRDQEIESGKVSMAEAFRDSAIDSTRRGYGEMGADIVKRVTQDNEDTYKRGGKVSGASKRADGIAQRGKTRGKMR
jgi:hypothetical protein